MTTDQNSTEMLRDEILADARREGEGIVIRARQDADNFLSETAAESDRERQKRLEQAQTEAARRSELILATVSVETGRLRATRIEALLDSVYEEAHRRLLSREGFDYRETVIALASHAVNRMAGSAFTAKVSEEDYTILGSGLADEIANRVDRPVNITVSYETDITGGGIIVEDGEARQAWDNRLAKRLERLWPELRQQIAVEASFVPAHTDIDAVK
jgi:vacuolar-type H+-ATPase subunit E/Vma4